MPFEEIFSYSGKVEDCGNNGSTLNLREGRFALNMRFAVDQLFRVMKPGCNVCLHLQTLLAYKVQHGYMGKRDFRGAMIDIFAAGGFVFTGEFVIQKNPQAIANRMNLHSLQFKTGYARNACNLAPCMNDWVVIMQKPGESLNPVRSIRHKEHNPGGWVSTNEWVRDAHGIWTDIKEIDVLQGARLKETKEAKQEKHVCPLQLEIVRRCANLYTNPISIQPDVTVMDCFNGIGSVGYCCLGGRSPVTKLALDEPRNYVGFELKESYYAATLKNLEKARRSFLKGKVRDSMYPDDLELALVDTDMEPIDA